MNSSLLQSDCHSQHLLLAVMSSQILTDVQNVVSMGWKIAVLVSDLNAWIIETCRVEVKNNRKIIQTLEANRMCKTGK